MNRIKLWIITAVVLMSMTGYLRLYMLIENGTITVPSYLNLVSLIEPIKIESKIFGHSTKGKPIEGYVIGKGQDTILLMANIHGNETGTKLLLDQFVAKIKSNPNIVSRKKRLVIIPLVNPDGYEINKKMNANSVNLNLNFDTPGWDTWGPLGTYAGPKPFSEVESQIIKQVVLQYKPNMMISYHAQGALVAPEESQSSFALAEWYADETGYTYEGSDSSDLNFWGTATMWFVRTTGNPAITVELPKLTESDWDTNKKALNDLISSNHVF